MVLTRLQAKAFYDRFGSKQDWQGFYEDRALADMIAHSAFEQATRVFEFGCGTGRLAERLLRDPLSQAAEYTAVDISTTMVSLTRHRLQVFGPRVQVSESSDNDPFLLVRLPIDRVVSTYVLDLLADEEINLFVQSSARVLAEHGRICLVSLTTGTTPISKIVSSAWQSIFQFSPRLVGGCRPINLISRFRTDNWIVLHHDVISAFGIRSEVIVAEKRAGSSPGS